MAVTKPVITRGQKIAVVVAFGVAIGLIVLVVDALVIAPYQDRVATDKLANSCKTLLSELQGSNDVQAISNYNENCAELTGALTL
jgi:hypothetical protein